MPQGRGGSASASIGICIRKVPSSLQQVHQNHQKWPRDLPSDATRQGRQVPTYLPTLPYLGTLPVRVSSLVERTRGEVPRTLP